MIANKHHNGLPVELPIGQRFERNPNNFHNAQNAAGLRRDEPQRHQVGESRETRLEKEVALLKQEVRSLKLKVEQRQISGVQSDTPGENKRATLPDQTFVSKYYPLIWGAEKFFMGKKKPEMNFMLHTKNGMRTYKRFCRTSNTSPKTFSLSISIMG